MTCTTIRQVEAQLFAEPGASPHTFDSSSERWEFVTETLQGLGTLIESQSTLGTRFADVAQTRKGIKTIGGDILFEPTKTWFDSWLPRVLGANESTDTFAVAETLQTFGLMVYRKTVTATYSDCYVNRLSLRGSVGQLMQATVNIMGMSNSSGSLPSKSLSYSDAGDMPYVFSDGTLTLASEAIKYTDIELIIDNALIVKHTNSVNPTSICPGRANITLRVKVDPDSTAVISALSSVATTGIAGVFALTNGIASTTFTFGKLVKPDNEYTIATTGGVDWDIELTAKKNNSTAAISVVNEDTA